MEKWILIFSGYNQRAVVAFLRTLIDNDIYTFSIFASGEEDPIFLTAYAKYVAYVRKNKALDWEELCAAIDMVREKYCIGECMVVPSTEALNRSVLKNRGLLERHHCVSPMVKEELYIQISDKESFWKLCKARGFCVPEEIQIKGRFERAFAAKPRRYMASDGKTYSPVLVVSEEEFNRFLMDYPARDFTFQEYVKGKSFYLLYYFTRDGQVYRFSQVNYAQQPGGKSILAAACADLHHSAVSKEYEGLFLGIGYYGFLMLELREREDRYYMIEANPRFWGPSQLFCDAGCNFFEYFLYEYGFLKRCPVRKLNFDAKYLWGGGVGKFPAGHCTWHGDGYAQVQADIGKYLSSDIYCREDTMGVYTAERGKWA